MPEVPFITPMPRQLRIEYAGAIYHLMIAVIVVRTSSLTMWTGTIFSRLSPKPAGKQARTFTPTA